MRGLCRAAVAAATAALMGAPMPSTAAPALRVELALGGGTLAPWEAFGEAGNAFGGGAMLAIGEVSVGIMGASVWPESRGQAAFAAMWVEARWHLLGRDGPWSPYGVAGLGLALADRPDRSTVTDFARWSSDGPHALAALGAGIRYGRDRGMWIALDLRAWNHTHGGVNLTLGYTF